MSNLLIKVSETEVKTDKNERNYKTVGYTEVVIMKTPFGDIMKPASQCRSTRENSFEKSYLNDKPEIGYNDPIFNAKKPADGGLFQGAIVTREVTPYDIENEGGETREVNTYTCVVFGDTNDVSWESKVRSAFKAAGHELDELTEEVDAIAAAANM
jgi:hypothetical protein